jgi:hypothetical protein
MCVCVFLGVGLLLFVGYSFFVGGAGWLLDASCSIQLVPGLGQDLGSCKMCVLCMWIRVNVCKDVSFVAFAFILRNLHFCWCNLRLLAAIVHDGPLRFSLLAARFFPIQCDFHSFAAITMYLLLLVINSSKTRLP